MGKIIFEQKINKMYLIDTLRKKSLKFITPIVYYSGASCKDEYSNSKQWKTIARYIYSYVMVNSGSVNSSMKTCLQKWLILTHQTIHATVVLALLIIGGGGGTNQKSDI